MPLSKAKQREKKHGAADRRGPSGAGSGRALARGLPLAPKKARERETERESRAQEARNKHQAGTNGCEKGRILGTLP